MTSACLPPNAISIPPEGPATHSKDIPENNSPVLFVTAVPICSNNLANANVISEFR